MAMAIFEQYIGSGAVVPAGSIGLTAIFCVSGLPGLGTQQEVRCDFIVEPLDTPLEIKRKLSNALADFVLTTYAVTMANNDMLLPDMTRGQII